MAIKQDLSARVFSGDKQAFEQLYKAYVMRLLAYVRRFTENEEDAEDVIQQSFMKLWESIQKRQEKGIAITEADQVQDLLFMIVRNTTLNYLRDHAVQAERVMSMNEGELHEELYEIATMRTPDHHTIYKELREQVNALIARMPAKQREVFVMSREGQMKNLEIANQLGITVKAVEKHITAALKFLREHLDHEYLLLLILLSIKL